MCSSLAWWIAPGTWWSLAGTSPNSEGRSLCAGDDAVRLSTIDGGEGDLCGVGDGEEVWEDSMLFTISWRGPLGEDVGDREGNDTSDLSDGAADVTELFVLILLAFARTVLECADFDEF
ncbi:hypothetical protein GP486_008470 [Trichoglossum hirsutum]|uniref:Secreted protein n=1 Tax=Trichoglossum hirsutum TaxID=265104 RepID=A0A9P8ICI1_9PEZI|nr:hypothetical protein GP486_008470 [Trichoglossum hirsutum]